MHSHARQLTHRLDLLRSTSKSSGKLTSGARALGVKTSLFIHQNPVRSVSTRQSMNSSQRTNKKGKSYTRASCWTLESRRRLFHSKNSSFGTLSRRIETSAEGVLSLTLANGEITTRQDPIQTKEDTESKEKGIGQ